MVLCHQCNFPGVEPSSLTAPFATFQYWRGSFSACDWLNIGTLDDAEGEPTPPASSPTSLVGVTPCLSSILPAPTAVLASSAIPRTFAQAPDPSAAMPASGCTAA